MNVNRQKPPRVADGMFALQGNVRHACLVIENKFDLCYFCFMGISPDNFSSLADNIENILHGTEKQKERLKRSFYLLAKTPQEFREAGITGEFFIVSYSKISRHKKKDVDHAFSSDEWRAIGKNLESPSKCVITKYAKNDAVFNIFTKIGHTILIGVEISSNKKNISINVVRTVFRKSLKDGQEIIYPKDLKKLAPAQQAVLAGTNLQQ